MHVATVTQKNPLGLENGRYICEDVTAGQMLANGWASGVTREIDCDDSNFKRFMFTSEADWNGKHILFVRPGGFGDLLFLTPTIREIKKRWPTCKIAVACFDRFRDALANNPDVDAVVKYPVWESMWKAYDAHIWLENIIENNPDALTTHAVDLIAGRVGIELSDKSMRYVVTKDEFKAAVKEFPAKTTERGGFLLSKGQKRVGIQITASGACRQYPHMGEVAQRLWREGHEVFIFGRPGEIKTNEKEGLVNVTALNKSFRESAAIAMTCDVIVGPDSAFVHLAGALGIPCVALYGPFPWTLRTAYAPKTFALQGVGKCAPCFHHHRPGNGEFPVNCPSAQTGKCEVLGSITVERVIREVEKKLERKKAA